MSSEIFQRKVHEALDGLPGIHCVTDDVIVAGTEASVAKATKSHDDRLETCLQRCQDKGVVLNADKFDLRAPQISFIGHLIGMDGNTSRSREDQSHIGDAEPPHRYE